MGIVAVAGMSGRKVGLGFDSSDVGLGFDIGDACSLQLLSEPADIAGADVSRCQRSGQVGAEP